MKSKRSMIAARAKVDEEACCRVCGNTFQVEAAHILARSRIRPGPAEDPRNIVPLGGDQGCACHRSYDEGLLDILPYLTHIEQAYAVELVGIAEAYQRITGERLAA